MLRRFVRTAAPLALGGALFTAACEVPDPEVDPADEDDLETDPDGDAGDPVGCGVIAPSLPG